jgi:hypothetical protein
VEIRRHFWIEPNAITEPTPKQERGLPEDDRMLLAIREPGETLNAAEMGYLTS